MKLLTVDRQETERPTPAPKRADALEFQGDVAILSLGCPAPSAWTPREQGRFLDTLNQLVQRRDLTAIILYGTRLFSEREPMGAGVRHDFHSAVEAIADCPIPVIAAIGGDATGSGLELALACEGRVATPGATFAIPDLQTGRLPVHGAIERLPRLVGLRRAAEMIIFGLRWDAATALAAGLIDAVAPKGLIDQAKSLAGSINPEAIAPRQKTMSWERAASELSEIRHGLGPEQIAPLAALKALEIAAQLPLRRAAYETAKIAEALSRTDQARALAYVESGSAAWARCGPQDAQATLAQRLRWPLAREIIHLLDEGANPGQIDRCLVAYGFAEGLFAQADRRGLAAIFSDGLDLATPTQPWLTYSPTLDLMADAGRLGGDAPGWYRYSERNGDHAMFDAEVGRLIESSAMFQRMTRQPIADAHVMERCLMAMINASAVELQSGKGLRKEAIDAIWSTRLGFPAWKGGPLYQAREIGLPQVVSQMSAIHARRNTLGAPSEILVRTAARRGALG